MNDDALAEIRNKQIGFIFQFFNLLPHYSAVENVELPLFYDNIPPKTARQKAIASLEMLGLKNRIHYFPNQLSGSNYNISVSFRSFFELRISGGNIFRCISSGACC